MLLLFYDHIGGIDQLIFNTFYWLQFLPPRRKNSLKICMVLAALPAPPFNVPPHLKHKKRAPFFIHFTPTPLPKDQFQK